uniref:DUF4371 domain-containing protein n=1 Tax=Octopus bimaculoides TaxID=37653 RepID=A0A0L8HMQ2_OCTBM
MRNTVADRISDLFADLERQLKHKVKSIIAFSVTIDESTDILDVTQLTIFTRGVYETLTVALDRVGVDRARAVSMATDGAPSVIEKKANKRRNFWIFHCILHQEALCCKSFKMDHVLEVVVRTVIFIRNRSLNHHQFHNLLSDIGVTYGLPYQTEVRWLGRGAVLKRFFNLREIEQFMEKNGKPVLEFQSSELLQHLAFNVDITEHLNYLNKLQQVSDFTVFRSPFTAIASDLPVNIQLEMIDLQCDSDLNYKFTSVGLNTFYQYLFPKYPKLTALAAKV